jgi:AcrR family transcriptional regulator
LRTGGRQGGEGRVLRPDDGRLQRGRRARARIREAARGLFRERGFDGATLRAIAERAGMGASSIYRHVRSKEELLVEELSELQEEAWTRFRQRDDPRRPTQERVRRFLAFHHQLLEDRRDLTTIALRATTHPEARASRRVLALHDRGIGLLTEILQNGRLQGDLSRDVDVLEAARAIFHVALGVRIAWANGLLSSARSLGSVEAAVGLFFCGMAARPEDRSSSA